MPSMQSPIPALLAALLASLACASKTPEPPASTAAAGTPASRNREELLRAAGSLERASRFLEASFFLEAALLAGADEEDVLRRLVAAEVRSGRLRSAKQRIERLRETRPGDPEVAELAVLLDRLTPSAAADGEGGDR